MIEKLAPRSADLSMCVSVLAVLYSCAMRSSCAGDMFSSVAHFKSAPSGSRVFLISGKSESSFSMSTLSVMLVNYKKWRMLQGNS